MAKEVKNPEDSSIKELLENYNLIPNMENAMTLGRAIAKGTLSIEVKKWRFKMALDVQTADMSVYSTIKAWASLITLEDNIPSTQKIIAVKELLNNPDLKPEVLDEIITNIFVSKEIPRDLLNYIAPEIQKASRISAELKSYVLSKKKRVTNVKSSVY